MTPKEQYDKIIDKAKSENRKKLKYADPIYVYYENHHIIPDFFFINRSRKGPPGWLEGDPEDASNKVLLTGREHFDVHILLTEIYPEEPRLIVAIIRMIKGLDKKSGKAENLMYEELKIKHASAISKLNAGRVRSPEFKAKQSKAHKGVPKPRTKKHQQAINKALKGVGKGKKQSNEHVKKRTAHRKGQTTKQKGIKHTKQYLKKFNSTRLYNKIVRDTRLVLNYESMMLEATYVKTKWFDSSNKGNHLPEAHRKNISKALIGRPAYNKIPVLCIELNQIFNSISGAAKFCGMQSGDRIRKCANTNKGTSGGYHWSYVNK